MKKFLNIFYNRKNTCESTDIISIKLKSKKNRIVTQSNDILVSVCLVTYNQKEFIKDAIESALMQKTNFEYEIVIGDDYSTDGTLEICIDYANKYPNKIKVLRRERNLGLLMNFFETIKKCRGELIAYLEGDDYWLTDNKLQQQAEILLKDNDISLVHTDWKDYILKDNILKDNARNYKGACKSETTQGIAGVKTFLANGYGGIRASSIMFRTFDINDIMVNNYDFFRDEDIKTFDYFIFCQFSYRGFFRFLKEDAVLYRMNINSISIHTDIKKATDFSFGALKTIMYLYRQFHIKNNKQYLFNRFLSSLLAYCLENNDHLLLEKINDSLKSFKTTTLIKHKFILFCMKHHLIIILRPLIYLNYLRNKHFSNV